MGITRKSQRSVSSSTLERAAFSIPEICFRNDISRTAYHRLRSEGRGPRETRFGLNLIRVTLEDEREWLHRLQEDGADFEVQAAERAVKAGTAAASSPTHVSKRRRRSTKPRSDAPPAAGRS
jgi:hypothetical protein